MVYFIAGIDPGIYTGYAFLSLSGQLLYSGNSLALSYKGMIKIINDFGTPSLIATDVKKPSSYVQKVASHFSIPLFSPNKDIPLKIKKSFAKNIKNPHERDAYVSALKAFHYYQNRFRSIESKNIKNPDFIKHKIIRGFRVVDILNSK